MIGFTAEDLVDLRRWAICGAIVVLTHGGIAAAMVGWGDPDEVAEPAAAIVIEFAPVPVAPAMPQMEIPPGPEQVVSDASPNKPTESLEEKIEEKIEQKVEAKLEQKIEEKVEVEAGRRATAGSSAGAQSGGRDPAAAAGGQAGDPEAAGAAPAGAHDVRSAGNSRADGGDSGRTHAGPDHPPEFAGDCEMEGTGGRVD